MLFKTMFLGLAFGLAVACGGVEETPAAPTGDAVQSSDVGQTNDSLSVGGFCAGLCGIRGGSGTQQMGCIMDCVNFIYGN